MTLSPVVHASLLHKIHWYCQKEELCFLGTLVGWLYAVPHEALLYPVHTRAIWNTKVSL